MATYYIAPTGSDTTGDGSVLNPWKSIQKFASVTRSPGDILYCRGGTYTSLPCAQVGLNAAQAGTLASPITIRNYPGEVPVMRGPATGTPGYTMAIYLSWGTDYVVVDGLQFEDWATSEAGVITIGQTAGRTPMVSGNTIRNCRIVGEPTGATSEHGIYVSEYSENTTIEDNIILGPAPTQAYSITGGGIHLYHDPIATGLVARRNIIRGWKWGFITAPSSATGTGDLIHNTFIENWQHIYLWRHAAYLIRDNAGDTADNANIYDPNNPENTTASFNFWGQTFDSNYFLDSGDSGWKAASDGLDAGALNVAQSAPGPGVGLTHAFVSNRSDGGNPALLQPSHWNAEHVIGNLRILANTGSPEGVVTAPVGSLYLRTDGGTTTTLYVKTSGTGNTGWTAK